MIADATRMGAFARALGQAIKPGAVVIDIGTGTGICALLACRHGARRVYAIEPDDAIQVAREIAAANGYADRIEFIQAISTQVTLPERADVIVSDLGGVLPWFQRHIPSIVDARARFLAPGGVLIPQQDVGWAAVVEAHELVRCRHGSLDRQRLRLRHGGRPPSRRQYVEPSQSDDRQPADEPATLGPARLSSRRGSERSRQPVMDGDAARNRSWARRRLRSDGVRWRVPVHCTGRPRCHPAHAHLWNDLLSLAVAGRAGTWQIS